MSVSIKYISWEIEGLIDGYSYIQLSAPKRELAWENTVDDFAHVKNLARQ